MEQDPKNVEPADKKSPQPNESQPSPQTPNPLVRDHREGRWDDGKRRLTLDDLIDSIPPMKFEAATTTRNGVVIGAPGMTQAQRMEAMRLADRTPPPKPDFGPEIDGDQGEGPTFGTFFETLRKLEESNAIEAWKAGKMATDFCTQMVCAEKHLEGIRDALYDFFGDMRNEIKASGFHPNIQSGERSVAWDKTIDPAAKAIRDRFFAIENAIEDFLPESGPFQMHALLEFLDSYRYARCLKSRDTLSEWIGYAETRYRRICCALAWETKMTRLQLDRLMEGCRKEILAMEARIKDGGFGDPEDLYCRKRVNQELIRIFQGPEEKGGLK